MPNGKKRIGELSRRSSFAAGRIGGAAVTIAGAALIGVGLADARKAPQASVATLLPSSQTVAGERIAYPAGAPAKVTAAVITLPPGASTGWHTHGVPLFGYILDGELTVDYGVQGTRVY